MTRTLLPAATLWQREVVRFRRQGNRMFSALAQPVMFWLLFGLGFGTSFRLGGWDPLSGAGSGGGFLEYLFPGAAVLVVFLTAIFSTVSIIEDRHVGFLQGTLVAPVSRTAIVLGKVTGGATLAVAEALPFLCLAPFAGLPVSLTTLASAAAALALVAVALTAFGVAVAWPMRSTQGFHTATMILLMPSWLLSGAFFPLLGAPAPLVWIMWANPFTYGVALVRHALYEGEAAGHALPPVGASLAVTLGFAAAAFIVALLVMRRRDDE